MYERIDVSEKININKSKGCMIYYYHYFKDIGYSCELYICKRCHDLWMALHELNDFMILNMEGIDYKCYVFNMSKNDVK